MDISVPTANSCYTQLKPLNAKQCPLASNSHHSLSQKVAVSALILQQLSAVKRSHVQLKFMILKLKRRWADWLIRNLGHLKKMCFEWRIRRPES